MPVLLFGADVGPGPAGHAPAPEPTTDQAATVTAATSSDPPIQGSQAGAVATTAAPEAMDAVAPAAPPRTAPFRVPLTTWAWVSVSVGQGTVHLLDDDLFDVFAGLPLLAGDDIPNGCAKGAADFHPVINPGHGIEWEDFADGADKRTRNRVAGQVIDLEIAQALADPPTNSVRLAGGKASLILSSISFNC